MKTGLPVSGFTQIYEQRSAESRPQWQQMCLCVQVQRQQKCNTPRNADTARFSVQRALVGGRRQRLPVLVAGSHGTQLLWRHFKRWWGRCSMMCSAAQRQRGTGCAGMTPALHSVRMRLKTTRKLNPESRTPEKAGRTPRNGCPLQMSAHIRRSNRRWSASRAFSATVCRS